MSYIFERFPTFAAGDGDHLTREPIAHRFLQRQAFIRIAKQLDQLLFDDSSDHFSELILCHASDCGTHDISSV